MSLTPPEIEVLSLVASGSTNRAEATASNSAAPCLGVLDASLGAG